MIVCLRYKNVTARTRKKNYAGQMKIFWIDMIGETIKMFEDGYKIILHAEDAGDAEIIEQRIL